MQLEGFLLRARAITKKEYLEAQWRSMKGSSGATDADGFLSPAFNDHAPMDALRPIPFGDALQHVENGQLLQRVFKRLGVESFSGMLLKWYQFHVDRVEPISDYSLTSDFGKRLYTKYADKVLCGLTLADSSKFGIDELIHDEDYVIIPEGTSAFVAGLAICGRRRRMVLITSNGALVRELQENPLLSTAAEQILVAGGELDGDLRSGHPASRGFIGNETQEFFTKAIKSKPGATVVISSVSGLLPASGPYAPKCPKAGATRYSLLRDAARSNVRQIVFLADYTKLRDSCRNQYGDPIYSNPKEWKAVIEEHRSRITFVVTPPPELVADAATFAKRPCDRSIFDLQPENSTPEVKEYLAAARDLDALSRGNSLESRFFEIDPSVALSPSR